MLFWPPRCFCLFDDCPDELELLEDNDPESLSLLLLSDDEEVESGDPHCPLLRLDNFRPFFSLRRSFFLCFFSLCFCLFFRFLYLRFEGVLSGFVAVQQDSLEVAHDCPHIRLGLGFIRFHELLQQLADFLRPAWGAWTFSSPSSVLVAGFPVH